MGDNNLTARVDGERIPAADHNELVQALLTDLVPRNNSRVAQDIVGSLGTSAFRWLRAYVTELVVGNAGENLKIVQETSNRIAMQNQLGDKISVGDGQVVIETKNNERIQLSVSGSIDFYTDNILRLSITDAGINWSYQPNYNIPRLKVGQSAEYAVSGQFSDDDFDGSNSSQLGPNYITPFPLRSGVRYMIALIGDNVHTNADIESGSNWVQLRVNAVNQEKFDLPLIDNFRMPLNLMNVYVHTVATGVVTLDLYGSNAGVENAKFHVWEMN